MQTENCNTQIIIHVESGNEMAMEAIARKIQREVDEISGRAWGESVEVTTDRVGHSYNGELSWSWSFF